MLDYRYLKAFHCAAKNLNFGKAAQELRISPSALTRQIRLLEESCGGELFLRSTRHVVLTQKGEKLYASVQQFNERLSDLDYETVVRVGCLQSVFEFTVIDLIAKYPKLFDGPLDIALETPEMLHEKIIRGELDIIFTNKEPADSSQLSSIRLFQEQVTWIAADSRRPIIFSAFEHYYPKESLQNPNRIRINSFNATVALTRRKIGKALVAKAAKIPTKAKGQGVQWTYLVMPNYKIMPERLGKIVAMLRKEFGRV